MEIHSVAMSECGKSQVLRCSQARWQSFIPSLPLAGVMQLTKVNVLFLLIATAVAGNHVYGGITFISGSAEISSNGVVTWSSNFINDGEGLYDIDYNGPPQARGMGTLWSYVGVNTTNGDNPGFNMDSDVAFGPNGEYLNVTFDCNISITLDLAQGYNYT